MIAEEKHEFLRLSGYRPRNFRGSLTLPPSKSYLHRALFVSSLCTSDSRIENVGSSFSEDVEASKDALRSFGMVIEKKSNTDLLVHPKPVSSSRGEIFAGGSGTTARFAIAFAAIPVDGGDSVVTGDASLLKRPMQPLLDALTQIGIKCYSKNSDGKLPVVVQANGIKGGVCRIDGSISSQFISALLIACTQGRNDTAIEIENPLQMVSVPYLEATQFVLKTYGFKIKQNKSRNSISFRVSGNQTSHKGRKFSAPGDMSSAAAVIGATLAAKGKVRLNGVNLEMPQADSVFLNIAKKFGASVLQKRSSVIVSTKGRRDSKSLNFDLKNSPDIVPIVAGVAAAIGQDVKIRNVGHLRFKESDRLNVLSKELSKIGMQIVENQYSISIASPGENAKLMQKKKPTILSSENDHRILMALAIAGMSGKFGELLISNPSCVNKSYPSFISDLKSLTHNENILSVVERN